MLPCESPWSPNGRYSAVSKSSLLFCLFNVGNWKTTGCAHDSQRNLGQGKKSSLVMALYCPNHPVQLPPHSPMITFCTQIIRLQSFCERGRNSDPKFRQQEFTCTHIPTGGSRTGWKPGRKDLPEGTTWGYGVTSNPTVHIRLEASRATKMFPPKHSWEISSPLPHWPVSTALTCWAAARSPDTLSFSSHVNQVGSSAPAKSLDVPWAPVGPAENSHEITGEASNLYRASGQVSCLQRAAWQKDPCWPPKAAAHPALNRSKWNTEQGSNHFTPSKNQAEFSKY